MLKLKYRNLYIFLSIFILLLIIILPLYDDDDNEPIKSVDEFVINSASMGEQNVVVVLPKGYVKSEQSNNKKYPMVILFAGRGESYIGNFNGARGWIKYYNLNNGIEALRGGQLNKRHFKDMIGDKELQEYNKQLALFPYKEMFIVCPYTRDGIKYNMYSNSEYEFYIINELYQSVLSNYTIDKYRIGVGGVSLGGGTALFFAFKYPEIFKVLCSLQPVVFMDEIQRIIDDDKQLNVVKGIKIDLVTSDRDNLKNHVTLVHNFLQARGINHDFTTLRGRHDYAFNMGPGQIELLMYFSTAFQSF